MNQEAVYILNRRIYKESSLLLDVFSPNYGRLTIIANGALKSKKGWSALLQVFQPLLMNWTGRSSIKTLVSVDAPSESIVLQGRKLFSAYYLNELLIKLVPQENSQITSSNSTSLFIAYANALQELSSVDDLEIPLRQFEYHLLTELGVLPDIAHDINGSTIERDKYYQFVPQVGFKIVSQSDSNQRSQNFVTILGLYLLNLSNTSLNGTTDKQCLFQIKRLMRVLIFELLGGQELKSRALFQSYQPFRSSQ